MDERSTYSANQAGTATGGSMRLLVMGIVGAFLVGVGTALVLVHPGEWRLSDLFNLRSDQAPVATAPLGQPQGRPVAERPAPVASEAAALEAREAVERVEQVEVQTGGIDQRVAALEQRLTRLDLQSQAAAGNAARAEGMLIAFASRRALERGQPLGYLEDQLRLRFGDARPNAVQTVIDASSDPVTLDELLVRLDGLGANLAEAPKDRGILRRIGYEFSRLFSVRTEDTPSPVAEQRLLRARGNLENGQIERAIAEVRAMPNPAIAESWLADAERYAAAQQALEVLEAAAVGEPRELRDAEGRRVRQPGPAN